ncbi:hypothetical protein LJB92_01135 [Bacteroidales bacterium OttesenSCG-928-M06]|nr:hypothetical protein [Bacteroidales bacterium OttesenSCG-928-M06]
MQSHQFIELLKNPELLDNETLVELSDLLDEFPYFQAARLLYTMNLRELKDSLYYPQLRKTACYMVDRRMLFYRVEKDFSPFLGKLGGRKTESSSHSSFELIDFFLSQEMPSSTSVLQSDVSSDLLTTDYLSFAFKENAKKQESNINDADLEKSKPLRHQEAIDKFLKEDEKSPIRVKLKDTEESGIGTFPNLDKVDETSFFSETLAKIYLKQKKYEKALEIIRKLNLIYPEKNRYFADQIRFLEKLIINTKK